MSQEENKPGIPKGSYRSASEGYYESGSSAGAVRSRCDLCLLESLQSDPKGGEMEV
jgi:hypothetical protein